MIFLQKKFITFLGIRVALGSAVLGCLRQDVVTDPEGVRIQSTPRHSQIGTMIFGAKCEKPRALSVFVSFLVLVLRQREVQLNLDVGGVGRQAEGRGSQTRQVEEDPGARRPL